MKKVLFVASVTLHINTFHIPYLKQFKDKGYQVEVASNGNEEIKYCDKHYNIEFARSPLDKNNIKAYKELKKIINDNDYEIIHCHTPTASVLTRLAAKKARKNGTRVIYTAHGFHFYKGAPIKNWLIFYPIEWFFVKYTDTLITINTEDYERAKKKFAKRCKDIQYVPGVGIDEKKFDFEMTDNEKHELRESLGVRDNDFVMIFPARLDKNKNQIFLINVMEKLVKEHSNIHLLLPGQDELNGYYQRITKERKIENNIHFLGQREDIPKLLRIADLAVSSSLREGLPVNVLEAFAAGKPVVALNCRGMEDLIVDGKNGFIVDMENCIEKYIERIKRIYNINKNNEMFLKNKKNEADSYDINNLVKNYSNIYFGL